jgi:cyanate lyase
MITPCVAHQSKIRIPCTACDVHVQEGLELDDDVQSRLAANPSRSVQGSTEPTDPYPLQV